MHDRTSVSTPFGTFTRYRDGELLPTPPTPWNQRMRMALPEAVFALLFLSALLSPMPEAFRGWLHTQVIFEFASIIITPIVTVLVVLERDVWKEEPFATFLQFVWIGFGFFVTGFLCDAVAGTSYMRYSGILTMFARLAPVYSRPHRTAELAPDAAAPTEPGVDADGSRFYWDGELATPFQIARIKQMIAAGEICACSLMFYVVAGLGFAAAGASPIGFGAAYFIFLAVMRAWLQAPVQQPDD